MKQSTSNKDLVVFFVLAFAFSWLLWLIGVLQSADVFSQLLPNMVWVVIGAHGPLVAAFGLTFARGGGTAARQLLRAGFVVRIPPVWWAMLLLSPFILSGLAVWLSVALTDFQPDLILLGQPLLIIPTFLMMFFFGGSFQEEFGWRGYALPRLLARFNPVMASLILGAIWSVWHLPLFFISGLSQSYMPFGIFLVMGVAFSVLFTWAYIKTNRNLFTALLFHTAINTSLSVFPPFEQKIGGNHTAFIYLAGAYALVALGVVITDRAMRAKVTE